MTTINGNDEIQVGIKTNVVQKLKKHKSATKWSVAELS